MVVKIFNTILVFLILSHCLFAAASRTGDIHICDRECWLQDAPMLCQYNFRLENYVTFSKACYDCPYVSSDCDRPDCIHTAGVIRPVTVVNRMFPGPKIVVCAGDTIVVDVENSMATNEAVSFHWHGQHMKQTPFMDGVPMVTQCPIHKSNSFRYNFKAEIPGTHFWHAHTGHQRSDGAAGMLVIRRPQEKEIHRKLYDYDLTDHQLITQDWMLESTNDKFVRHHFSNGDNKGRTLSINGKGVYKKWANRNPNNSAVTPIETFCVKKGHSYRFRVVSNVVLVCPLEISIDGHQMLVIESDGHPFEPVLVDSFVIYGGERVDFVVEASNEVAGYRINVVGLLDCAVFKCRQSAILLYVGAKDDPELNKGVAYESMLRGGMQLNPFNTLSGINNTIITDLKSMADPDTWLSDDPDYTFYLAYDFYAKNGHSFHDLHHYRIKDVVLGNMLYMPMINNISNMAPSSPLLTQYEDVDPTKLCPISGTSRGCQVADSFCECVHILKVELNSIVEVFIIDEGFRFNSNHPFHLHGYNFYVLGTEKFGTSITRDEIIRKNKSGDIRRNFEWPIKKDTVTVPDGGYTLIKFRASNPGFWLMHCHLHFHGELGMAVLFQVGEPTDMPKAPENFPKCGNFKPSLPNP